MGAGAAWATGAGRGAGQGGTTGFDFVCAFLFTRLMPGFCRCLVHLVVCTNCNMDVRMLEACDGAHLMPLSPSPVVAGGGEVPGAERGAAGCRGAESQARRRRVDGTDSGLSHKGLCCYQCSILSDPFANSAFCL